MPVARVGDININYKVEGEGEPLLMIMGYGSNMDGWYFQSTFFAKRFRVITLDNRGVGGSDKPKGPYSTKMMAEDPALAKELEQKLIDDAVFRSNPEERLQWFYKKTPFYDERAMLYPVGRE